jgi:hypothetical protein
MKNQHLIQQKITALKKDLNRFADTLEEISNTVADPVDTYTPLQVQLAVCRKFDLTKAQLFSKKCKKPNHKTAKQIWALMLSIHVTPSKSEVSRIMGYNQRHGCLYILQSAHDLQDTDKLFMAHYKETIKLIK